MFKITPCNDTDERKNIAEALNFNLHDDSFIYVMKDIESGALMGACQFEIYVGYGEIIDIKAPLGYDDFEAMFILGRQTMNFIDLCGAHIARAKSSNDHTLIKALGFKENDGVFECDMTGMFDGSHCSGHKNNTY